MQQFEADGVIYQDLGDGNVKVIGYADQPPADPAFPYAGAKAQGEVENVQSTIQDRSADNRRADQQLAAQLYQKGLQLNAQGDVVPIEGWVDPSVRKSPEQEAENQINKDAALDNIIVTLGQAKTLGKKGLTTEMGSLLSYVPGTDSRDLSGLVDTLQANLSFDRLQDMRNASKTGGALGGVSERELQLLGSTVASLDQGQSQEQFINNLEKIEKHYKRFQIANEGIDPDSEQGKKAFVDKTPSFTDAGPQSPQMQLGIEERFSTDQDKKFAALAQSAFDRGASAQELNQLAKQYGYTEKQYGPDLDAAIKYRDEGGRGARLGAPESGFNNPNIAERARQAIGSSPVGGYFGGAANALSLGFMDEIQGGAKTLTQGGDLSENIAEADLIKSLGAQANPKSNLAGNVSGGILGAMATGGIAGAGQGAVRTLAPRAIAGDAMFGAGFGAGENNQNRLGGAIMGAGAGAGGGIAGRGATRKLGGLIGGSSNQPARTLYEKGVTLTPGQIRGGAAMQKESRLAGMPGSDVPITRAQERGYQQFNKAAFDEGLQPVGGRVSNIGELGIEEAREAAQKGYGFLDDVNLQEDKQIIDAIGGRIAQSQEIPNLGDQTTFGLQKSIDGFFDESGQLTGRNFQNIQQNLTRRAGKFDNSLEAVGPDAASVLRGAKDDFGDMAARQAPEIMPQLRGANQAYGNYKTLQEAVSKGKNTGGVFSPAQLGMAAESAARKYGGKHATTQRPFFELQRAGQQVLPQTVPDSGTAGRASVDGILNTGKNMVRGATNRAIYNEPVLELMNKMAFERPEVMQAIGEAVKRRSRLGGLIGAPALLPAVN